MDRLVRSHIWLTLTFITCLGSWGYGWDADNQLFVAFSAVIHQTLTYMQVQRPDLQDLRAAREAQRRRWTSS
jgi:hypothetical protein